MPIVTPRTWVAGDVLTAAQLNVDVRDNVTFLANPPSCRVTNSTTQSLTDNLETVLTFDTETYDTAGMHSTAVNTGRITIVTAGLYLLTFSATLQASADTSDAYADLQLGVATRIAYGPSVGAYTAGGLVRIAASCIHKLAAADYVQVVAFQNNTANTNRTISSHMFAATWIGLG